jgi:hypothetical protein
MKLQEIKKFVREFPMPETLVLDKATKITDFEKFFESHIAFMESKNNPKRIKMIHYERVLKAIKLLRENKGAVKTMTNNRDITIPPPEKQNEAKITNNNDIDFNVFEGVNDNSAMKPNVDFETIKEVPKTTTKTELSTPPKQISTPPKKISTPPKKDKQNDDSQMTLF